MLDINTIDEIKSEIPKTEQIKAGLQDAADTLPSPTLDAALNPQLPDGIDDAKEKAVFKTRGEKIHKWGTYLGIDWLFNATAGATFAYWGNFTESGKKMWSGPITRGFTKLLKTFTKNEAAVSEGAKMGNIFMSIIAGGMFTIPPLMVLEHNKVKKSIVESLDKTLHGPDAIANDERIKQAHEDIANAPKKDFLSGNSSRFAALAPLLTLVLIKPSGEFLQKNLFDHIASGTKFLFNKVGLTEAKLFGKYSAEESAKRWQFLHNGALGMDLGFGIPYAILHEFFYTKFAGIKAKKKSDEQAADTHSATPANTPVVLESAPESDQKRFADKFTPSSKVDIESSSFADKIKHNTEPMSVV